LCLIITAQTRNRLPISLARVTSFQPVKFFNRSGNWKYSALFVGCFQKIIFVDYEALFLILVLGLVC
jgi:hypothetical protein